MKVTLKTDNPNVSHDILLIPEPDCVSITTTDGRLIAKLNVETMELADGRKSDPTKFFLSFDVNEKSPLDKNIAMVH